MTVYAKFFKTDLLDNEALVYLNHPHWVIFVPGVAVLLLSLLFYFFDYPLLIFRIAIWKHYPLSVVISVVLFFISILSLISALIRSYTSLYALTNKRIVMKTGWVSRNSLELFLDRVEAIHVNQTVCGRILGYGVLIVIGTGGTQDLYPNVPEPFQFRKVVQQEVDKLQGGG